MVIDENEIYQSLRISTIFSGHTFVTTGEAQVTSENDKKDEQYFAENPKRRFLLRISNSAEFDAPALSMMSIGLPNFRMVPAISPALQAVYDQIPPLWALVSRIQPSVHVVTAVYRRSAFFQTDKHSFRIMAKCATDGELATVLKGMSKRIGLDGKEWNTFEARYHHVVTTLKSNPKSTRVN